MAEYALVETATDTLFPRTGRPPYRNFDVTPDDISHKGLEWRVVEETRPTFNPATQVRLATTETVEATRLHRQFPVRLMTTQELADAAIVADQTLVRSALLDVAEILIIHVDAHLANGNIVGADFNAATRAKYRNLKTVVDRLRNV